ncbi:MAG TPA: nitroreductase [Stellaceae bacterium]|nr:nitroreductase [Stellaceae bacterium]
MDALHAILTRTSPPKLEAPAPDDATLARIIGAGMRAPDHGRLKPWRFIIIRGDARARLGEVLAKTQPRDREKPLRAPLILVVAAHLEASPKIPAVEQILAAGAAAQNIQLAAHALGFGTFWRTGWPAYDALVKAALGLAPDDAIIGFLYMGTPVAPPPPPGIPELGIPELAAYTREWTGL